MSDARTTLLESWEEVTEESSTPGFSMTRINLSGDGHCQAIINAVSEHYSAITGRGRPSVNDLETHIGEKVTLIWGIDKKFGGSDISAIEGKLFDGSRGLGILPKGSRKNGYSVKPEQVLDLIPGYDTARAAELVAGVRAHFPVLKKLTRERFEELPSNSNAIMLCMFGTWHMPDGACVDSVWLVSEYLREDDILDGGVLLIRPEIGMSEHGSVFGRELLHGPQSSFGEVVGFEPITFKEALELTELDFDEALRKILPVSAALAVAN